MYWYLFETGYNGECVGGGTTVLVFCIGIALKLEMMMAEMVVMVVVVVHLYWYCVLVCDWI